MKKPRYQVNSHPLGPQGPIRIKNFGMFEIFRKTHLDTGLNALVTSTETALLYDVRRSVHRGTAKHRILVL